MGEQHAGQRGHGHRAGKSLPGLARADARNHFVPADQRADGIGSRVAELGDEDEVEHIVSAVGLREEIDLLNEVQEPGNIHQPKECSGDSKDARGVAPRDKLADAKAEDENDQQAGFKVVRFGRRLLNAQDAREVEERAGDQQQPAENAPFLEANQPAPFHHAVKLHQSEAAQRKHDDQENAVRNEFVAGEERPDHDGPQNNRSEQAAQKDLRFGRRRR